MHDDHYAIAELDPEDVNEIKRFEQQLSEKCGQPITLIAYSEDQSNK